MHAPAFQQGFPLVVPQLTLFGGGGLDGLLGPNALADPETTTYDSGMIKYALASLALMGLLSLAHGATTICRPLPGGGTQCETLTDKQDAQRRANDSKGMELAQNQIDRWCSNPDEWLAYLEEGIRKGWWADSLGIRTTKPMCR